jgi:hypothetical protein
MKRTELEKRLEALTLEYLENHKGRCNEAAYNARDEMRILTDTINTLHPRPMTALTKDQVEYTNLVRVTSLMSEKLREFSLNDYVTPCRPKQTIHPKWNYAFEDQFYLFLECMEGKHNDFLQKIIDNTPKI